MAVTYRLQTREPLPDTAPALDADQQAVVDHPGGPLLVLAGPGTGKTTTLVEAVVDRIANRGLDPSRVLVLTFGRKAADALRDRVTARLRRTTSTPLSSTFHSFCYALVRSCQPSDAYTLPLRLLSSAEQDVRLRELVAGSQRLGTVDWPASLRPALRTRGFARELHGVLSRARELGLSPADVRDIGAQADRPEWEAAGRFMEEYLTVLDFEGALDYAELVHRAVLLAETPRVQADLRRRFAAVFVDEYQDTDPGQARLLRAIAGDGRDLVVVGDPDQSIYAFRGADVRGILDFPDRFRTVDGARAPVVALSTTRRFGPRLLRASRRIAAGIGVSGAVDADTFRRFRSPSAAQDAGGGEPGDGKVEVLTFPTRGAEADAIADLIRRAHLEDGLAWSDIAVLVRSGAVSIPTLRRSLVSGGVPVQVAGDELPLRAEPAVQPLLEALSASLEPAAISADSAHRLISSPLAGVDAAGLRRLSRDLRRAAAKAPAVPDDGETTVLRAPSAELLRLALAEPASLADIPTPEATAVRRLATLLAKVHAQLEAGGSAEEALWTIWDGVRWGRRLRAAVERGGAAARCAHRDLDAVCALFQLAARVEERQNHTSVPVFLEELRAHQIPSDSRSDVGVSGDAVRLLTAHRSKGLEWRLVVVAGVQDGSWPDLRRRGSLLQADRLSPDGAGEPAGSAALLAEERRLFYVAATRARERLVVTAVAAPELDGDQPSRFLDLLGVVPTPVAERPEHPLSLPGIVSSLRRALTDPAASPALRRAAAARLARLAGERVGAERLAPAADPANWWGLRERTQAPEPVRPADEPTTLTASALGGLLECPLRWFLSREAAGESQRSTAQGFGNLLHVLADALARDDAVSEEQLLDLLDSAWRGLAYDGRWIADREHAEARAALRRLVAWHRDRGGRTPVGTERAFDVVVGLGEEQEVRLVGRVDRLERDRDDAVHVVDFKTSKSPRSGPSLATDPQLGLYQLAVEHGAFSHGGGDPSTPAPADRCGGAELVQLRVPAAGPGGTDLPAVQQQAPQRPDESGRKPVELQLLSAAGTVREERFDAMRGQHCRTCQFQAMCPAQVASGALS